MLNTQNKVFHKINNLMYEHQAVVLCAYLIPLICVLQLNNKLLSAITSGILFFLSLLLEKSQKDARVKPIRVFILACALAIVAVSFLPTMFTPEQLNEDVIVNGTIYHKSSKSVDLKVSVCEQKVIFPPARIRLYTSGNSQLTPGDNVVLQVRLKLADSATNPGQFDYHKYLQQKGISAISNNYSVIKRNKSNLLLGLNFKIRQRILKPLMQRMPTDVASLYAALMMGERSYLKNETVETFQGAGASHIIVISGLHLGLLSASLMMVLSFFKVRMRSAITLTILFVWLYAWITGFSVSILRASIMITIALLAQAFYFMTKPFNTLGIAAVVILVINPLAISNIGWQLSFAATAGILGVLPVLNNLFGKGKIRNSILAVIAAQITTLPIVINRFSFLSIFSIPANITLVPLVFVALLLGILYFIPLINYLVYYPLVWTLRIILKGASFWSSMEGARFSLHSWPLWITVLYSSLIIIFILIGKSERRRISLILLTLIISVIAMSNAVIFNNWRITFLDVGQGDSAVLQWPNGYTMLIDGGNKSDYVDYGASVIIPFLRQAGVNKIDALLISHSHDDHVAGLISVANKIRIEKLYLTPQAYYHGGQVVDSIIDTCLAKGTSVTLLSEGKRINIAPGSTLEVFNPVSDVLEQDDNNTSLVIRISYGKTSALFTGDIEKGVEDILSSSFYNMLEADILKTPHHGSNTSSTTDFLKAVKPKIAVCSVGRKNKFGHPHQEIVQRYLDNSIRLWRTDLQGAIMVNSDGQKIKVTSFLGAAGGG